MRSLWAAFPSQRKQAGVGHAVSHYSHILAICRPRQAENSAESMTSPLFTSVELSTYLIVLGVGYLHTHRMCWEGLKFLQAGKIFICYIYCHWFLFHLQVRPGEVCFTDSQEKQTNFRITVLGLVFGFTGPEALSISVKNFMYVYRLGFICGCVFMFDCSPSTLFWF